MADQIEISQVGIEVLHSEADEIQVSQLGVEVLHSESDQIEISQVGIEVLYEEAPAQAAATGQAEVDVCLALIYMESQTVRVGTTFFVDSYDNQYLPWLKWPTRSDRTNNQFWGVGSSVSMTLKMEYGGNAPGDTSLKDLFTTYDPRGALCQTYRYRPGTVLSFSTDTEFVGEVKSCKFDDSTRTLEIQVEKKTQAFGGIKLPRKRITAEEFDDSALNVGMAINVPIGTCFKIPCGNILEDTVNDYYDYVVGVYGIRDVLTVYRESGRTADVSEYTVLDGTVYPSYVVLRFTKPQRGFQDEPLGIFADVDGVAFSAGMSSATGASYPKQIVDALKYIIESPNCIGYPLGCYDQGFADAVEALEGTTVFGSMNWWIDYNIGGWDEDRNADDVLNDILQYTPLRLEPRYDGKYTLRVQGVTTPSYYTGDGYNAGMYDNVKPPVIYRKPISEALRLVKVRYANNGGEDFREIKYQSHDTIGTDRTITLPAVYNDATAIRVLSRIVKLDQYEWMIETDAGPDFKKAITEEVFRHYFDYQNGTYRDHFITSIDENWYDGTYRITGQQYDDTLFDVLSITPPTPSDVTDVATTAPATFVGTVRPYDASDPISSVEVPLQATLTKVIGGYYGGVPSGGEVLDVREPRFPFRMPSGLPDCSVKALDAATAQTILPIKKGGTQIGTATFAASGTVATLSFVSDVDFTATDIFYLYNAASADATLGRIYWTFTIQPRVS